jgi:glucose-6-phosphate isomerase
MFPTTNPTNTDAWKALQQHYQEMKAVHIKNLFAADADRYNKFSVVNNEFVFDYSKNIISEKTISLLIQLANECGLPDAIKAMFAGEKINSEIFPVSRF